MNQKDNTYKTRLKNLQKLIRENDCDAFLVTDKINLYYLTGLQLSLGTLLVHAKGTVLLVDGRYFEWCEKNSPVPVRLAGRDQNTLEKLLKEYRSIQTLGFDATSTTYSEHTSLKKRIKGIHKKPISLVPLDNPVSRLRSIKDDHEIALLHAAAALGSKGYDFVCANLKEGVTEIELSTALEIFWKQHGSTSVAFEPIIAFGKSSSQPHYRAGKNRLKKGDPVLIDIGVNLQNYHSDMTRVVFFGKPSAEIRTIFEVVKEAQQAALALCRPDTSIADLDQAARQVISSHGYGEYFPHSLGHGVGLEIHEWPLIRNTPANKKVFLQEGMVITIEPGIYLPNIGGVRLEDTIAITRNGYESLSKRSIDPVINFV